MAWFDWDDIVQLAREGQIPATIIEGWSKHHKRDLLATMAHGEEAKRLLKYRLKPWREVGGWITASAGAAAIILLISVAEQNAMMTAPSLLAIGLAIACWLITLPIRSHYEKKYYALRDSDWEFVSAYNQLLEWTKADPKRLSKMHPHELEQLATGLVTVAASEVLRYQSKSPEPPVPHIDEEKRDLMAEVELRHDTLRSLGLLQKIGYGHYYDAAKELLPE